LIRSGHDESDLAVATARPRYPLVHDASKNPSPNNTRASEPDAGIRESNSCRGV